MKKTQVKGTQLMFKSCIFSLKKESGLENERTAHELVSVVQDRAVQQPREYSKQEKEAALFYQQMFSQMRTCLCGKQRTLRIYLQFFK